MGRFSFGKIEVQFSGKKLNFQVSKNDTGHLHESALGRDSLTECNVRSVSLHAL